MLPTPESVCDFGAPDAFDLPATRFAWRQAGETLGGSAALQRDEHRWMRPIASSLAEGDFEGLESDFMRHLDRWDREGRLSFAPPPGLDTPHPITGRTRSQCQGGVRMRAAELAPPKEEACLLLRGLLLPTKA